MNTIEKINEGRLGGEIRGKYGVKRGNQIIRRMAEEADGCKYLYYGEDD